MGDFEKRTLELELHSGSFDAPDGLGGLHMSSKRLEPCECGAVYERTEEKLIFRDADSFECQFCGRTLDRWSGSRIPVFRLIKEPPSDASKSIIVSKP